MSDLTTYRKCNRCLATGVVYDEVFRDEWSACPYMNIAGGEACVQGLVNDTRLQAIADAWEEYRESGGTRYHPTFEAVASALITAFEGEQP